MKVLIDTCILIDYLQNRMPFADDAEKVLEAGVQGRFEPYFTAKAVSDVNYIICKYCSDSQEKRLLTAHLWQLLHIVDTYSSDTFNALFSEISDYEDALMVETAKRVGLDAIVTRNSKDYLKTDISIFLPHQLIDKLQ